MVTDNLYVPQEIDTIEEGKNSQALLLYYLFSIKKNGPEIHTTWSEGANEGRAAGDLIATSLFLSSLVPFPWRRIEPRQK